MKVTAVVLAAGLGKRMASNCPKVLHKLAGATFLEIILSTLSELDIAEIRLVINDVIAEHKLFLALKEKYKFKTIIQKAQLGTADALRCGIEDIKTDSVLVLNGDAPLITKDSINAILESYTKNESDVLNVGFQTKSPQQYGRLITYGDDLIEIVEHKDSTDEQKKINICNSGIYVCNAEKISVTLSNVQNKNASSEYYLTDIVKIANRSGYKVSYCLIAENEAVGVNNNMQKARAENLMQKKLRKGALNAGVTMLAPETVFLSFDTKYAPGVIIHQYVVINNEVELKEGVEILPFTHIEGAVIGANTKVGPYARIRPNTVIGEDCRIGNFVEVKSSDIGNKVKTSHLAYIGDAKIDEGVNIGAGTIFCNYDGYLKHQTSIGRDTFIGSNTALVAPITIGRDVIIGAGSVITEDVADNALAIARARQSTFQQKAEVIRDKKKK